MAERPQVLEMRHVTKRFPGTVANDDVSFDLLEGEVHALLGENGAGKSTLMNILYGLYHADEGEIVIKGTPVRLGSPSASIGAGVGMVHQHFMLIPVMTVAENIVLDEPTAVLTPQEAQDLFEVIRGLTARGKSVIFITHKLNEVLDIADRITVLRRGKLVETLPAEGATEASLARL